MYMFRYMYTYMYTHSYTVSMFHISNFEVDYWLVFDLWNVDRNDSVLVPVEKKQVPTMFPVVQCAHENFIMQ